MFVAPVLMLLFAHIAGASVITLDGIISQSTQDTGTPAGANASLNNIADGDTFHIALTFSDPITSPGTFALTSILFTDSTNAASESGFISGTVVVSQAGSLSQFAVVGCLIDIPSCFTGNQLALDFQLPTAQLSGSAVAVQSIPGLLPIDLLEDGGVTDIQGSLNSFAYSGSVGTSTPEPSSAALALLGIGAGLAVRRRLAQ